MFFLPLLLSFEPNKIDLPLKSPFEIIKENKSPKLIEETDFNNQIDTFRSINNLIYYPFVKYDSVKHFIFYKL